MKMMHYNNIFSPSGRLSATAGSMSKYVSGSCDGSSVSVGDGGFSDLRSGYVCGWGNGKDSSLLVLESSVSLLRYTVTIFLTLSA